MKSWASEGWRCGGRRGIELTVCRLSSDLTALKVDIRYIFYGVLVICCVLCCRLKHVYRQTFVAVFEAFPVWGGRNWATVTASSFALAGRKEDLIVPWPSLIQQACEAFGSRGTYCLNSLHRRPRPFVCFLHCTPSDCFHFIYLFVRLNPVAKDFQTFPLPIVAAAWRRGVWKARHSFTPLLDLALRQKGVGRSHCHLDAPPLSEPRPFKKISLSKRPICWDGCFFFFCKCV